MAPLLPPEETLRKSVRVKVITIYVSMEPGRAENFTLYVIALRQRVAPAEFFPVHFRLSPSILSSISVDPVHILYRDKTKKYRDLSRQAAPQFMWFISNFSVSDLHSTAILNINACRFYV